MKYKIKTKVQIKISLVPNINRNKYNKTGNKNTPTFFMIYLVLRVKSL